MAHEKSMHRPFRPLQRSRYRNPILVAVLVFIIFLASLVGRRYRKVPPTPPPAPPPLPSSTTSLRAEEPPTWDWLREWERDLPQHDLSLPLPDGAGARYVKFSNQAQGLGWNNVLSEL